jgi:glycosyltransferase involved in cell wall biosynthesis
MNVVSRDTGKAAEAPTRTRPLVCIVYSSADFTGAFVAIRRQAELLREDADFLLVLPKGHHIPDGQLEPFARVVQLPIVEGDRSVGNFARQSTALLYTSVALRRLLASERCERVQMNCFTLHHGTLLRLLGFRGRIVTWVRSDPSRLRSPGRLSLRLAKRSSDVVVAISKYVRDLLPFPDEAALVYDPVGEAPYIGASDEPVLALLGNYIPMKGQDHAIEAFHRIAERHPSARLVLHGNRTGLDGSVDYLSRLQQLAANGPGAGRIEFRDFVPLAEGLSGKRAALMPSRWEPFGLACQDAALHGLPVIATRSGGPEEMVEDGRTGYLVEVGGVDALADRMDRLLADPELARSMGKAGRDLMLKRFPASRFKQQLRELFAL